jgi:rsbT co-antagonist protein RsbR
MNEEMAESLKEKLEGLRRKNAELEEVRRRTEESYRRLIEDQRELVCRFSTDGLLTFVNDAFCRYFGKPREQLVGSHYAPLVPDEELPLLAATLAQMSREAPVVELEFRVRALGGEIRWINWRNRALFDGGADIVEYQAVGLDVTDRKRAEEQAQRNEALARLLEEQNLELSTPLIPIADDVLAMPLIGRIDEKRAQRVLETLLHGVVASAADTVLLDVTGVARLDAIGADAIVRTAKAVALLGARAVLTGVQPHVAQTLVTMGLDMAGVITRSSLKEGIAWAMQERSSRTGRRGRGG